MTGSPRIGIDLGTTHSALAWLAEDGDARVEMLDVPTVTAPGTIGAAPLLASFLYLPNANEFANGDLTLPWGEDRASLVGELARERGGQTPLRLVSSAKSWLSHAASDRRGAILPVEAAEDVTRVSPVEASTRYLTHLARAWDAAHPEAPIRNANVVLTVPASFDPVARELTAEAATKAGIESLTLLEEPQAALYAWIERMGDGWREHLSVGDLVLVIDVGGGTTDFSLIAIEEEDGQLAPRRVAVGDHILLGGDNMDLTLAHVVKAKLDAEGKTLDAWQMRALTLACRGAKETLFDSAGGDVEAVPVVIPARGSKLIGGSIRTEVTLFEATRTLLEGFFPDVPAGAVPTGRARTGLVEMGLPYAQDAAITRHLAAFLARHADAAGDTPPSTPAGTAFARPTAVLFNGGVFKSPAFQNRIVHTLGGWLRTAGVPEAKVLPGSDLDLACARGAAYYAAAREGRGVRIRGGTARAYYVGVEGAVPAVPGFAPPVHALCVAPFGLEEGAAHAELAQPFGLVVGEAVRFRFFASSTRRDDGVGTRLTEWAPGELDELNGIEVTLPADGRGAGDVVPVRFRSRVNETGTLELEAVAVGSDESWKIRFDLRSGTGA